ncbi:MAG: PPC domain-containing DNA-binding protein [Candidatus Zixiibacteriota bacterium]
MQIKKGKGVYIIHIETGEDVLDSLKKVAEKENLQSASIQGIGTTSFIELGYFNNVSKGYDTVQIEEDMEMLNVTGSISQKNGEPIVHLHGTFGDDEFNVFGGHVIEAKILATGEFFVYPCPKIERTLNADFKLSLFDLDK